MKTYLNIRKQPGLLIGLFLLFPILHFFIGVLMHYQFGFFFMDTRDPEYFHLLSGVGLAYFKLDTGYIDHPGIPIQILIAIASRLTFWFSGSGSLAEDVVLHPEKYIFAANVLYNLVFAVVMFIVGRKASEITKNIWTGVGIQMAFFGSIGILRLMGRLTPDGFMMIPLGLMIIVLLKYVYDENSLQNQKRYVLHLGILSGLGLAIKLSFVAYLVIPLIVLKGIKNKIISGLFALLFFFVFAFPVLSHLNRFWTWGSEMFLHSEKWGGGESNIIDLSLFSTRFMTLIDYDVILFVMAIAVLICSSVLLTFVFKKERVRKFSYMGMALSMSVLVLMLLVTKHFGVRYFVSAILLKSVLILWIFLIINELNKSGRFGNVIRIVPVLFLTVIMMNSVEKLPVTINKNKQADQLDRLQQFHSKVSKDDIILISGDYSGSPFKSFALAGGFLLAGPSKRLYRNHLKNNYSKQYMKFGWDSNFFNWDHYANTNEILNKKKAIFIFCGKTKHKDAEKILTKFRSENPDYSFSLDTLIHTTSHHEMLFRLNVVSD